MDEIEKTSQTYAQIAAEYAQARQHRHMLARHVTRFVALVPPGGLVWDVGCGPGFDTAVLRQHHLHAFGLDYSYPMIIAGREQWGRQNIFIQADMRRLPLAPCADGLWACASLLHLPRNDAPAALQEFYRVFRISRGVGAYPRGRPEAGGYKTRPYNVKPREFLKSRFTECCGRAAFCTSPRKWGKGKSGWKGDTAVPCPAFSPTGSPSNWTNC